MANVAVTLIAQVVPAVFKLSLQDDLHMQVAVVTDSVGKVDALSLRNDIDFHRPVCIRAPALYKLAESNEAFAKQMAMFRADCMNSTEFRLPHGRAAKPGYECSGVMQILSDLLPPCTVKVAGLSQLCTVRLDRKLWPHESSPGLVQTWRAWACSKVSSNADCLA